MKFPTVNSQQFALHWRKTLADYITAIAWTPDGQNLVASNAAGEVILRDSAGNLTTLQPSNGVSVDCITFSRDGQFLAAGGQDGRVRIWHSPELELVATLENATAWVDKLAWSPTSNQLAISIGRYVQVWDADTRETAITLNFDNSSVLGIDWHPDGQDLAIAGYQAVKIWQIQDWNDDPYVLEVPSASVAIAWSPDGKYLASGNMDRTITVLEWKNPYPWVMRGFPGKIRQLAWSQAKTQLDIPLLASSSVEGIVVWEKQVDESLGWEGRVLQQHTDTVQAIAFEPHSFLLASAAADGWLCLWQKAKRLVQRINNAGDGFSCLAWHPQGEKIAAGTEKGELLIWAKTTSGQGFARG